MKNLSSLRACLLQLLCGSYGLDFEISIVPAGFFTRLVRACGLCYDILLCLRVLLRVLIVSAGLFMRFVLAGLITTIFCACGFGYEDFLWSAGLIARIT